jgi:hypothetical protein
LTHSVALSKTAAVSCAQRLSLVLLFRFVSC